jgi:transcription elongation factor S-II
MNPGDHIREARSAVEKEDHEKRRTDLYNRARQVIQEDIGINNEGGEFVCSRCKGTKTTHYSMQTRSSDEPMTVFICCLTCGKRWRQ